MKKSELTLTGDTYRTTPTAWGESFVMVDEDAVSEMMAETFGEPCDPDGDQNDRPETVHIAIGNDGKFYAILEPYEGTSWGRKTGEVFNENLYRPITNPAESTDGTAEFLSNSWETFDSEDDE